MILAAETNFILELVLGQHESDACEKLVELSRESIVLMLPAFSLVEAAMFIERRRGERRDFIQRELQPQIREATGSGTLARFASTLDQMNKELRQAEADENARMLTFRSVQSESLQLIPITTSVLTRTDDYQLNGHIEQFPDALVFASVISAMEEVPETFSSTPKYFLSRDKRFSQPWYLAELRRVGCSLLSSFNDALAVARKHL
jgi:hypothetical protein